MKKTREKNRLLKEDEKLSVVKNLDEVIQREIEQIIADLKEAKRHTPKSGKGWSGLCKQWLTSAEFKIKALKAKISE